MAHSNTVPKTVFASTGGGHRLGVSALLRSPGRWLAVAAAMLLCVLQGHAQRVHLNASKTYVGELGIGLGAANYYGDLNAHNGYEAVKPAAGLFFRYFFADYFGASLHVRYGRLGYSDVYNDNAYEHYRNLSFNTDVWAFTLQGDFNFFRFQPGSQKYRITPYLSLGAGMLHFNPYAYYHDQKVYLQPLGTEGQGSDIYPDREKYALWTLDVPVEIGIKYNLSPLWNLQLSASYHFTGTDYLDDVSTTYAGPETFYTKGTEMQHLAAVLQDRSGIYGLRIGQQGRQRGDSRNKDQLVMVQLSISYLFTRYRCPY